MQTCNPVNVQITPIDATPTNGPWLFGYLGRTYNQKASFPVIDLPKDSGCHAITFAIGGNGTLSFNPTNPVLINGVPPASGGQIPPPPPP